MQSDIKAFVLLKYKILTSDPDTWELCNTYPLEVKNKWAWRCAESVEHFAERYKSAEKLIRVSKSYRDGLATRAELENANICISHNHTAYSYAATSCYYAAISLHYSSVNVAAAVAGKATRDEKWKLYIEWLIEELCEYETNHIITA